MISGQPPGTWAAIQSMAAGIVRYGVGSAVPIQSNSSRKRERSASGSLAPWEMTSGRTRSRRSPRTHRIPLPLGAHSHLWALPVQYAGAIASRSSGTIPGVWAPSTNVSIPRASKASIKASIGNTSAVGLVTWLTTRRRVRGVTAARCASTTAAGSSIGIGDRRDHHARPVAGGHGLHRVDGRVVLVVVGEQLVARLEAQAWRTVLIAVLAFGTNAMPSGSAWRKAPTAVLASSSLAARPRVRNAIGSCSSWSRKPRWTASTSLGHAPYEPWLKNMTAGSSCQPRSVRISRRRRARRAA